ncbi:DEDD exonuclease domain-containing protein [Tessaracoccus sp. OH4464_COT-324]|uniref:DEDD exonuclease domain-containing protein n=1 Tax=Tessaracoccus sp. OH4464_COT-324 TaxID=2491059 RepID=UPI000F63B955|nr:DEDD exonuclease domain-containing protein [Tessaracoccus sp. OH4464_COT-324]RRD45751.1 DEDD exnuclease domain-containing protein [Tessaracoccus sp. OH4464_COT-324]
MASPLSQPSFDDLGTPLHEATFVVVDLETTGPGAEAEITEIGAVKLREGEVVGTFQTLIRPQSPIPAMIQVLTGITNELVADQPTVSEILPSFLEFLGRSVLVAHNARFDVGFLRRAFATNHFTWPSPTVIDTLALARNCLARDEVRNHKLGTLAAHFGAATVPTHRALSDALATADVLHGLLERIGNRNVRTVEELVEFLRRVSPDRRAKRVWAESLPEAPGVYWFERRGDAETEVLYVGRSARLRSRVRSYFSAGEKRRRMHEMVRVATGVGHVECHTLLEAQVRELRMIDRLQPHYNRRSRRQEKLKWLRLTPEMFPRLAVVSEISGGTPHFGPFASRRAAQDAMDAIHDAFPLRRCTRRLSTLAPSKSCPWGDLGRCAAPCLLGEAGARYSDLVRSVEQLWLGDVRPLVEHAASRLRRLVAQLRYEEASSVSRRVTALLATAERLHRVRAVAACPEIVAAQPSERGWDIHVIRHGRLAGASSAPTSRVRQVASATQSAAGAVLPPAEGKLAATLEEAEMVARWLEQPGVRLIEINGEWAWPVAATITERQFARLLRPPCPRKPASRN